MENEKKYIKNDISILEYKAYKDALKATILHIYFCNVRIVYQSFLINSLRKIRNKVTSIYLKKKL
jgi:hypothetical protein